MISSAFQSIRSTSQRRSAIQIGLHEDAVQSKILYSDYVCEFKLVSDTIRTSMDREVSWWYTTFLGSEEPRFVRLRCMHRAHGSEV